MQPMGRFMVRRGGSAARSRLSIPFVGFLRMQLSVNPQNIASNSYIPLSIPFVGFLRMQHSRAVASKAPSKMSLNSLCGISSNATFPEILAFHGLRRRNLSIPFVGFLRMQQGEDISQVRLSFFHRPLNSLCGISSNATKTAYKSLRPP